jgi:hypothetical protein
MAKEARKGREQDERATRCRRREGERGAWAKGHGTWNMNHGLVPKRHAAATNGAYGRDWTEVPRYIPRARYLILPLTLRGAGLEWLRCCHRCNERKSEFFYFINAHTPPNHTRGGSQGSHSRFRAARYQLAPPATSYATPPSFLPPSRPRRPGTTLILCKRLVQVRHVGAVPLRSIAINCIHCIHCLRVCVAVHTY